MQFLRNAPRRFAPKRAMRLPRTGWQRRFNFRKACLNAHRAQKPQFLKMKATPKIAGYGLLGFCLFETLPVDVVENKAFSEFQIGKLLGAGGCGTVWVVTDKDGKKYALKACPVEASEMDIRMREVDAMKKAGTEHVVKCYDAWMETMTPELEAMFIPEDCPVWQYANTEYMFFMKTELCESNLSHWINGSERRPSQLWAVFRQVTKALVDLHGKDIMHRDIKPDNIFLNFDDSSNKPIVKLGDLGLAKMKEESGGTFGLLDFAIESKVTSEIGTFAYMAPEQRTSRYNHKVDIYALGMLLWEMNVVQEDFDERHMSLMAMRKTGKVGFWNNLRSPEAKAVIEQLIQPHPENRPSAIDILTNLDNRN